MVLFKCLPIPEPITTAYARATESSAWFRLGFRFRLWNHVEVAISVSKRSSGRNWRLLGVKRRTRMPRKTHRCSVQTGAGLRGDKKWDWTPCPAVLESGEDLALWVSQNSQSKAGAEPADPGYGHLLPPCLCPWKSFLSSDAESMVFQGDQRTSKWVFISTLKTHRLERWLNG